MGGSASLVGCGERAPTAAGDWRADVKELKMAISGNNDDPGLKTQARRFVPPVVVEGAKAVRRGYRRART